MAAETAHVTVELWDAAIPVQLRLADSEVSSLEQPPTLYMLVPRQGYLHSMVPQALRLLQHLLPPGEDTPWFEHGALPLRWGVPAGVLYDLVATQQAELPWRLTIHFRGYPDRMLTAYSGEAALRGAFFNSLKEAAAVTRGSAQRVMEMAAGAQEDLFRQVLASNLARYRSILASLQLAPAAQRGSPPRIPLRLYVRGGSPGGYLASYEDIAVTSRPVAALAADGAPLSLRQALQPLLEEMLRRGASVGVGSATSVAAGQLQSQLGTPAVARSSGDGGAAGVATSADEELPALAPDASVGGNVATSAAAAAAPSAAEAAAEAAAAAVAGDDNDGPVVAAAAAAAALLEAAAAAGRVLVGGAAPPLDSPLAWLHAQLHAADYFLYVIVHMPLHSTS